MPNLLFRREIMVNSLHLIMERGLKLALGLIVGVYVIRYLGPSRYGLFSYVASLVGLCSPFVALGYTTVAVKEMVNGLNTNKEVLGTTLSLNLIGASLVFLVVNAMAWWVGGEAGTLMHILSLSVLFTPASAVTVYFQSIVKARWPALARSCGQLISAGLRLLAVFLTASLVWFVAIRSFVALLVAVLLFYAYHRYGKEALRTWRWNGRLARRIAFLSLPLLLTNLFNVVILRIDQVIIRQLLDETETGIYAAAATLSEAWYFIPGAFMTSIFPELVRLHRDSKPAYFGRLSQLGATFFYTALIIALGFFFVADWLVPWLLGPEYARSTEVLVIQVWAGAFVFLGRPVTKALIIADLNKIYLAMRLLAAGLNIGLNYLWIPSYGIVGAAWASLAAYAFAHVFSYALFRKTRPYFLVQLRAIVAPFRWLIEKVSEHGKG